MFRELLSIFRGSPDEPLALMGANFSKMLGYALGNTLAAGDIYFGKKTSPGERSHIYDQDIKINKLERRIRKQVVAHLAIRGGTMDVPYCLLLMGLVKDVERIGDYAKNLSEVVDLHSTGLPDDETTQELKEIRREVEAAFHAAADIFKTSDQERALEFIRAGRDIAHRCDTIIKRNAESQHDASTTTALVLGIRYYKRISGHILNVLSSVVMPLHKVDYYDEDSIVPGAQED